MQIKMKHNLKITIPETIVIGLFLVNIKPLKNLLIEKRNDLANLLMSQHASMISEQIESRCAEYKRIHLRLGESSASIEQVFETKEWINTLPTVVLNQSEIVKRLTMVHARAFTLFF